MIENSGDARYDRRMMSLEEIESAISRLSEEDFRRLRDWVLEHDNLRWDQQLEDDANSGKLDFLILEAQQEINARKRIRGNVSDHPNS